MARVPERDAALDWRHRHSWHARGVDHLLSQPRHGATGERSCRPNRRALYVIRALRSLDDGKLLCRSGHFGIEHHLRPSVALAVDRPGSILRVVAMGEVRA